MWILLAQGSVDVVQHPGGGRHHKDHQDDGPPQQAGEGVDNVEEGVDGLGDGGHVGDQGVVRGGGVGNQLGKKERDLSRELNRNYPPSYFLPIWLQSEMTDANVRPAVVHLVKNEELGKMAVELPYKNIFVPHPSYYALPDPPRVCIVPPSDRGDAGSVGRS